MGRCDAKLFDLLSCKPPELGELLDGISYMPGLGSWEKDFPDISSAAQRALERRGVTFRLNTSVNTVNSTDNEVRLDVGDTGVEPSLTL